MAKIIAWLVVIFIVLLALRMINMRKSRGGGAAAGKSAPAKAEPMVRCVRCTVYLPRAEAKAVEGGYACAEGQCAKR